LLQWMQRFNSGMAAPFPTPYGNRIITPSQQTGTVATGRVTTQMQGRSDSLGPSIDPLPRTSNPPASVDRLQTTHHPCQIFADRQITACQFLQRPQSMLPVVDRPEKIRPQQISQLPGIDAVTLAAFSQKSIPARITHYDLRDVRLQQVVLPSRPGSFFQGDVQAPA
jgi:hypothetical protein